LILLIFYHCLFISSTYLGAAYVAGLAVNYWEGVDELKDNWREDISFSPSMRLFLEKMING